jgi:hypothetical protein
MQQDYPVPPPELIAKWASSMCGYYEAAQWGYRQAMEPEPEPPSLKEQALEALGRFFSNTHTQASQMTQDFEIIRRALEALPDD